MTGTHRHDGWTVERQLRFLDMLARTRSVTAAARAAGMSRESAHRLRNRDPLALFAALWDRALAPPQPTESHNGPVGDRELARRLGNQFRREFGIFPAECDAARRPVAGDRALRL